MTLISVKNKIFPIALLLLAVTFNSFSGLKRTVLSEYFSVSTSNATPNQNKSTDAETPQSTEEQGCDDKIEDSDSPFLIEYFFTEYINHQVNHIYEFQIALYHEHHRVIFSPPPEA